MPPRAFAPPAPLRTAPAPAPVLRRCACGDNASAGGECAECRQKRLQRGAPAAAPSLDAAPAGVRDVLRSPGQPVGGAAEAFVEPRPGHSFAGVRVHAAGAGPVLRRQEDPDTRTLPAPHAQGDARRASPPGGVAIRGGSLSWTLSYVGVPSGPGHGDVRMDAAFTRGAAGPAAACRTVTFFQTVVSTSAGLPDTGHLLPRRDARSGASADVLPRETEPYFGAGPRVGGGLQAEPLEDGRSFVLGGAGRGGTATFQDIPHRPQIDVPPEGVERSFETAVICVDTGELLGSVRWGYAKGYDGGIAMRGATAAEVSAAGASGAAEDVRRAFYAGTFQHTLGGFARGSAHLTAAHRATLAAVAAESPVRRLVLVGASDASGGPEADPALSLARAQAAKDELVRLGVPERSVEVQGLGVAAREPNPQGAQVPANRRVDVQVVRGDAGGHSYATGSPYEAMRMRRQDPRLTLEDLADWILRRRTTHGPIPEEDWAQLDHIRSALRRWRQVDPTVPDAEALYGPEIARLRTRRAGPGPDPASRWTPPPEETPSFRERILDDARSR